MYFEQLKNNRIPFITSLIIPILRDSMFIYSGTFPIFIDYKLNRRLPQNGRNRNKMDGRWNVKRTKIFPFFICKIPVRKIIKQHILISTAIFFDSKSRTYSLKNRPPVDESTRYETRYTLTYPEE